MQVFHQLVQRLFHFQHRSQDLQGGNNTVTGRIAVKTNNMSGIFSADARPNFLHTFQHVAIANIGTVQDDPHTIQRPFQPEVGHFRANDIVELLAFEGAVLGNDVENGVAIAQPTVTIDHHHAVTITVKSDTGIGLFIANPSLQGFRRGRTCACIDVAAVWLSIHDNDLCAQLTEYFRGDGIGGTVGAVHHNFQLLKRQSKCNCVFAEFDVTPARFGNTVQLAELRRLHHLHRLLQITLDFLFSFIGQFDTATREDLDAVVAVHVMRGADNNTGGGVKSAGEISDARSRHHAEQVRIHTCR